MNSYYVNASTLLLLVDPPAVVYLSSDNTPETNISIRDYKGNVSFTSSIFISTTGSGSRFLDGRTQYRLTEPYSYATVKALTSTTWSLTNTFNISSQVVQQVNTFSTLQTTVSSFYTDLLSSFEVLTSSITIGKQNSQFAVDVIGTVNVEELYRDGIIFKLGGNIPAINTSTILMNSNYIPPSTNMTIGKTNIFTEPPLVPDTTSTNIILFSNLIDINNNVFIDNSGNTGINTSTMRSLFDISGVTTVNKLSYPFISFMPNNLDPSYALYTIHYINNRWSSVVRTNFSPPGSPPLVTSENTLSWSAHFPWDDNASQYYWTSRSNGSNTYIVYAPFYFLYPFFYATNDGINFNTADNTSIQTPTISFVNNRWLAITTDYPYNIVYSLDGSNWIPTGTTTDILFYDFTYGPNGYGPSAYIGIGKNPFTNQQYLATSVNNGSNWTTRDPPSNLINGIVYNYPRIIFNGSYYLCITSGEQPATIAKSTDLITWTTSPTTINNGGTLINIHWLNNAWYLVFVSDLPYYYRSTDGITWDSYSPGITAPKDINYNGTTFMAVGTNNGSGPNCTVSTDGINWIVPQDIINFSTIIEKSTNTALVNTQQIATLSSIADANYSIITNLTVTDNINASTIIADLIGINDTPFQSLQTPGTFHITPTSGLFVSDTINTNDCLVSSIGINTQFPSTLLDVNGTLYGRSQSYFSSIGIHKNPSYTFDISGSLNTQTLIIDSTQYTPLILSSPTVSSIYQIASTTISTSTYPNGMFDGINFTFVESANNIVLTGQFYNNLYRSTDLFSFTKVLSTVALTVCSAKYSSSINTWCLLLFDYNTNNWRTASTQDFITYSYSSVLYNRNEVESFKLAFTSNVFWIMGNDIYDTANSLKRSTDGVNWTSITGVPFALIYSIVYTGTDFIVSGRDYGNILNTWSAYRTNLVSWSNIPAFTNMRVVNFRFNGSTYMGDGFYPFGLGSNGGTYRIDFSSTDSVNWTLANSNDIYDYDIRKYCDIIWNGSYWARLYDSNNFTYGQTNSTTSALNWSSKVFIPIISQNQAVSRLAWDGTKFWTMSAGNWYAGYTTNITNPNAYISTASIQVPASNVFNTFTDIPAPSFTPAIETSTLTSFQTKNYTNQNLNRSPIMVSAMNSNDGISLAKYSYDGISWISANTPLNFNQAQGVAFNGQYYIMGVWTSGTTRFITSTDGINWSPVVASGDFPNTSIQTLIWDGTYFFVGGGDSRGSNFSIARSPDGSNWFRAQSGGFTNTSEGCRGIAYNGSRYVAVGLGNSQVSMIQYSDNGLNWVNSSASNGFANFGLSIVWTGTRWVAGGGGTTGTIQYSSDAVSWTWASSGRFTDFCHGLAWNGSMLVGVGSDNTANVKYSMDQGVTWSNGTNGTVIGRAGLDVIWNGNLWITTGNDTNSNARFKYSFNGINWSNAPQTLTQFPRSLAFNSTITTLIPQDNIKINNFVTNKISTPSNIWVAITDNTPASNMLKYSFDGSNWSNATINNQGTMTGGWTVAYNGKSWLAAFHDSSISNTSWFSSSNGITWNSNVKSGITPNREMFDLLWTGSYWIGVGQDTRSATLSNYTIVRSTDGSNWIPANSGGFTALNPGGVGIAFDGRRMVAVGGGSSSNQSIQYSDDGGVNWLTVSSNGFTIRGFKVATNCSLWVTVGQDTNSNATIKYSYNGVNWTNIPSNGFQSGAGWSVAWNGSMWVAVGGDNASSNTIKYSYDGINWSNGIGGFTAGNVGITVAWNGSLWVAGGTGSSGTTLKYSVNGINWSNAASGTPTGAGRQAAFSSNVFPDFQANNLSVFGRNLFNTTLSTNSIHLQTSSILFNNALKVNQPQLTIENATNPTNDLIGFTRTQSLFTQSTLGLRNPNPITTFDTQLPSTSGIFSNFPLVRGRGTDTVASTLLATANTWAALPPLVQSTNTAFYYRSGPSGNINYRTLLTGTAFFTGQHANLSIDPNLTPDSLDICVGLLVSSADKGYYSILPDGTILQGSNAIWTTESLPKIKLTTKDKDPDVWGVVTNHQNESYNSDGTRDIDYKSLFGSRLQGRIRINGTGEGAIWVTNINGNFENGDYICSSSIPGYGRKQDDDKHHSYTVGKITMSCSFDLNQSNYICLPFEYNGISYRKAFVGCTYVCS